MKKTIYLLMACLFSLAGCDKTDEQVTVKNEIKIKVYSTKTWKETTFKMDSIVGATVYLISDSDTKTAVTDNNGVATFSNVKEMGYCILASKGELSNLINKSIIDNETVGYLIIGVYNSQADINNSAFYSGAVIGGSKLLDANGDALINGNDKVHGDYLKFQYKYKDLNNDGIINVMDLVNGNLVFIDNVVEKTVFIGI